MNANILARREKHIFSEISLKPCHVPPGGFYCCSYNCLGYLLKSVMPVGILCESKRIKKDFNEQSILYSSKMHKHWQLLKRSHDSDWVCMSMLIAVILQLLVLNFTFHLSALDFLLPNHSKSLMEIGKVLLLRLIERQMWYDTCVFFCLVIGPNYIKATLIIKIAKVRKTWQVGLMLTGAITLQGVISVVQR